MSAEGQIRDGDRADFDLIETIRWEPETGFLRLDRHLARLENSARALGFVSPKAAIDQALAEAVGGSHALRIRLTLAQDGKVEVTTQPFFPLRTDAVWTLRTAEERLDSRNPLLRHKTTRREIYDTARAEFSRDEADEVILLNERGEICEGTITSIFIDCGDGRLLTPALACGLLPGVLRGELIETGKAMEVDLTVEDLRDAKAIFVGNSLRELIMARLA